MSKFDGVNHHGYEHSKVLVLAENDKSDHQIGGFARAGNLDEHGMTLYGYMVH